MTLNSQIAQAIYATVLAEDATYTDASGREQSVRVVRQQDQEELLSGIEVGVIDQVIYFRILRSSLPNKPQRFDLITLNSETFCVDECNELNEVEWNCFVTRQRPLR